ncbi:MAG: hypothetical protein COY38_03190 [Candidatus Aenigmarchaeota archaeon CG_4_10_14_0_8_um_filter_37_24]|nr:hypothetical protein [Candidatus Aenigmarchaeota archaeon]OIN87127.1 MAG: hypothetical protein AUJ50_03065 [Candidatus Aenigmarchaeota archaeon CG1_02_38_14]PIV69083.1 MAG: hypothetical protein COS07_01955 [Candidatus Aenigmarchaeota archaeon CG01_land_8_20_14_3_00_37_9]PIW41532.1 MAG: hypothetical protein COW21_01400 [Candidatus Aenigmarchaeota archaeon CG15_BIG_FIL_POST_REV_8_21_14_020_37_27]PIX51076.1 MAG: hypothetical protein COZ52_00745 [Candidatus Aenigmarchaeota archaeon CG_4_8_14_3_u
MKGQLNIPFVVLVFTVFLVFGILIVPKFITAPSLRVIQYEENYENTQMILISLLTSTYDGKTVQELIGDNLAFGQPDDLTFLKDKLDKLVEGRCYKLSTPSKVLAKSSGCTPKEYTSSVNITLPYNPDKLVENLVLVIN